MSDPRIAALGVLRVRDGARDQVEDHVAVEAALEIRVDGRALSVTLRTPGHDAELALGFLAGEGLIARRADVAEVRSVAAACAGEPDAVEIDLAAGVPFDWTRFERHFAATSACGLCGRAHLESLRAGLTPVSGSGSGSVAPASLGELAKRLEASQTAFAATGGLHAAAYCDAEWVIRIVREDVGRHNAVDKVAGALLEQGAYPAQDGVLWVSGRAGAEIVLKAARARIPVLAAVGAPSSLAIELADAASMTLIGFLREGRMNVYTRPDRLRGV